MRTLAPRFAWFVVIGLWLPEALADAPASSRPAATREFPERPLRGQKRPPCQHRGAVVINGGCWWVVDGAGDPPCEKDDYVREGRCYVPLFNGAERPPAS